MNGAAARSGGWDPGQEEAVVTILAVLLDRTGVDFSQYRRATVLRRIRNRMVSIRVDTMAEYVARLHGDPAEAVQLAERIAIKVSRFYRNGATFDFLLHRVLPQLAAEKAAPLRLWSAGCGYGEEPYTLALLLAEAGLEGAVDASDIDETALGNAAAGVFTEEALSELPGGWADRHFDRIRGGVRRLCRVRDAIRARVRFFRHDVTAVRSDPVAPPYDLVACRNVLIYLQPGAQRQALEALLNSVAGGGIVCLGEAEWPTPALAPRLQAVHPRNRVFRAISSAVQGVTS